MEFKVAVVKTAWVVMDSEVVVKVAWVVYKVAGVDYVAGVVSLENCSDTISQVVVCSDGWTVGRMGRIDLSIIQIFWPGPIPNDLVDPLFLFVDFFYQYETRGVQMCLSSLFIDILGHMKIMGILGN